jgi:hypothetical protein
METTHSVPIMPPGAHHCPEAARCLERALAALDRGLLATAGRWTEKARQALDEATSGGVTDATSGLHRAGPGHHGKE